MKIDVTGIDFIKFIKNVYDLSKPQGLGFLHYTEGGLTDNEAKEILKAAEKDKQFYLYMDYVKGRACKMEVWRDNSKLIIKVPWYDHTDSQLKELLRKTFKDKKFLKTEHNVSCNCQDCQLKRFLEEK